MTNLYLKFYQFKNIDIWYKIDPNRNERALMYSPIEPKIAHLTIPNFTMALSRSILDR